MSQPIASYAETNDADQTRALVRTSSRPGRRRPSVVRRLGAGKTTLTQASAGMGDGRASRIFIVARVHSEPGGGPDLIHATPTASPT